MDTIKDTRTTRGLKLYRERGEEIARTTANTYRVPSCSEAGDRTYLVHLDLGCCSCPDYQIRREACKHIVAATIYRAKRRASR